MIFVERIDRPAGRASLETALASPFTTVTLPDAAERIASHRSRIVIHVSHGSSPPLAAMEMLADRLEARAPGRSLPAFLERLRVLGYLTARAIAFGKPVLAHWTSADLLVTPDVLARFVTAPAPSVLHIHPLPFRGINRPDGTVQLGLDTHGAAHFVGGEIRIRPNPVPWIENYEGAMAFLRQATVRGGCIVPDGETFGDEAGEVCYRVRHRPAARADDGTAAAGFEFELLYNRRHNFPPAAESVRPPRPEPQQQRAAVAAFDPLTAAGRAGLAEWASHRVMTGSGSLSAHDIRLDDVVPDRRARRPGLH